MKMSSDIRVKTDKRHKPLYRELSKRVVKDSHELFFVCACLGYQRGQREPLGKNQDERFWSGTIKPQEWACYYAMHLAENSMDFTRLQDDVSVLADMEEYANAGMAVLMDELLCDYMAGEGDNEVLDKARCGELAKVFLDFLRQEAGS